MIRTKKTIAIKKVIEAHRDKNFSLQYNSSTCNSELKELFGGDIGNPHSWELDKNGDLSYSY